MSGKSLKTKKTRTTQAQHRKKSFQIKQNNKMRKNTMRKKGGGMNDMLGNIIQNGKTMWNSSGITTSSIDSKLGKYWKECE